MPQKWHRRNRQLRWRSGLRNQRYGSESCLGSHVMFLARQSTLIMPLFSLPCSQRISFFFNSTTEAKKAVTATNTSQRRKPLYKFLVMFNLQERDSGYSKASAEEEPELEVPNGSSKGRELEVTKSFFKNHGSRKRSSNFTSLAVSSFLAVIHVSQFQLFLNSYQGRVSMFCKATKVSKRRFVCLYLEMRPERLRVWTSELAFKTLWCIGLAIEKVNRYWDTRSDHVHVPSHGTFSSNRRGSFNEWIQPYRVTTLAPVLPTAAVAREVFPSDHFHIRVL